MNAQRRPRGAQMIPTLGFPSQKDAILHLYSKGMEIKVIAQLAEASLNSVYRSIADYNRLHGIQSPRKPRASPAASMPIASNVWNMSENDRRMEFHRRAAKAAHEALTMGNAQ